jgi:hypothetical protein
MKEEIPQKPKPTLEQKLEAYKKIAAWTKAQKEKKKPKMSENERARLQAFKNVMERKSRETKS